jgi:hypothetical protein
MDERKVRKFKGRVMDKAINIEWTALKACIMIQQKNKCAMCKKWLEDLEFTLHHIVPRAKGGKDELDNLIGLCNKCHDIAEEKELNREEIINYYKRCHSIRHSNIRYIKNEIPIQEEYKYPKEIILQEKYVIKVSRKEKLDKTLISKYGYNLENIAKMFRVHPNIVISWINNSEKEKILIKMLEGVKKSEDKNLCYIL